MTDNETTWLMRNIRHTLEERIKVLELGEHRYARLLGRDSTGRIRTWVVRASTCYKQLVLACGYGTRRPL